MLDQFHKFFDKLTSLVDKGKSVNIDYQHFTKVSTLTSMRSHKEAVDVWAGRADSEADWKLAAWSAPEGTDQGQKV